MIQTPPERSSRAGRALRAGCRTAAVLALAWIGSCARSAAPPSLVLVTIDTARWDHYGAYGDPGARTPVFDALARRGSEFRDTFVDTPLTLPSHTSMMTGAVSLRHGVRKNGEFALPAEVTTLAELLRGAGYSTAAVVSSVALARDRGLDQGFTAYDDAMPDSFPTCDPALAERVQRFVGTQRRADGTTAAALRAADALRAPAFLWVHYVDPHLPHDPPPPWNRLEDLSPYAEEVAFTDHELGRLLRGVESALGDVALAVVSDHGEGLGDHREDEHGMFLYDTTVRIPFVVVRTAGRAGAPAGGAIVTATARNVDVAPTLAALAGVRHAFPDGVDLFSDGARAPAHAAAPVISETVAPTRFAGGAALKAIRFATRKLVLAPRPEVYDLARDPDETHNLWGADPARDGAMRRALLDSVSAILRRPRIAPAEVAPVNKMEAEKLRALGYVTSTVEVPVVSEDESRGIDPKDLIDVKRSVTYVMDGRWGAARIRMDRFWSEHPSPPDSTWNALYSRAWLCQAMLEIAGGRMDAAEDDARKAVAYDSSHREAAGLLQNILRHGGG